MKPSTKKKGKYILLYLGAAILKVNVPKFKFEKANEYQQMYEEAF
jgi:hydrogenase maturation factor